MKLGLFILDMVFASVTQYKPEYKKKLMNALITVELHWRPMCYASSI